MALGLYFSANTRPQSRWRNGQSGRTPIFRNHYRWLAAALGQSDRIEEAKEALEKAIAIAPGSFEMYVRRRVPWMRPEDHAHMLEGLRKAGMPEERGQGGEPRGPVPTDAQPAWDLG